MMESGKHSKDVRVICTKKVDSVEETVLIPEYKMGVGLSLAKDYCNTDQDKAELIGYNLPDE